MAFPHWPTPTPCHRPNQWIPTIQPFKRGGGWWDGSSCLHLLRTVTSRPKEIMETKKRSTETEGQISGTQGSWSVSATLEPPVTSFSGLSRTRSVPIYCDPLVSVLRISRGVIMISYKVKEGLHGFGVLDDFKKRSDLHNDTQCAVTGHWWKMALMTRRLWSTVATCVTNAPVKYPSRILCDGLSPQAAQLRAKYVLWEKCLFTVALLLSVSRVGPVLTSRPLTSCRSLGPLYLAPSCFLERCRLKRSAESATCFLTNCCVSWLDFLSFFFVNLKGTRIGQASECFVYWKDPVTNDTWGLNFTSPADARAFRECCVSWHFFTLTHQAFRRTIDVSQEAHDICSDQTLDGSTRSLS